MHVGSKYIIPTEDTENTDDALVVPEEVFQMAKAAGTDIATLYDPDFWIGNQSVQTQSITDIWENRRS
jgi:hypothetical protein